MKIITSLVTKLTQRSDLLLATLLIAIIFMMIVPIPTILIDIMIAINIAIAIMLLMVSFYIPSPLSFAAFPSILLITTLFRLSLSVSTTRLILLQADAGEVIFAFGDFVVGGSLAVGLVTFLIITIVSFVVVTKGSERVAEVAARFSLDGMPGKQMSIDSDMRSGVITMSQAKQQRKDLENESQLYGAMDGAMKFVKGDAIAGIVIIFVNILGGLAVGMLQDGLSASEALKIYSILTIGDGLVAQIPALIIAVTAGIIVTRVSSGEATNLGADISDQILSQPLAMMVGAIIIFGFAWLPGFPTGIFLSISFIIGIVAFIHIKIKKQETDSLQDDIARNEAEGALPSSGVSDYAPNAPVIIEVEHSMREAISPIDLDRELAKVRSALYQSLGVPFPGIHLRFKHDDTIGAYSIYLYDLPVAHGKMRTDSVFPAADNQVLELLDIPFEEDDDFLPDLSTHWVKNEYLPLLQKNQIESLSSAQILSHHLTHVLRHHAHKFIGIQETHFLLNQADDQYSELVKELNRNLPISRVADIFGRLVKEGISIRDLRAILESIVSGASTNEENEKLTEYVRSSLKDQICYRYCDNNNVLPAYLIAPKTEELIRSNIMQTAQGISLNLNSDDSRSFLDSINQILQNQKYSTGKIVLLTSYDLRTHIRKLIELNLYDLPVLSFQELAPQITVQPLGNINLARLELEAT